MILLWQRGPLAKVFFLFRIKISVFQVLFCIDIVVQKSSCLILEWLIYLHIKINKLKWNISCKTASICNLNLKLFIFSLFNNTPLHVLIFFAIFFVYYVLRCFIRFQCLPKTICYDCCSSKALRMHYLKRKRRRICVNNEQRLFAWFCWLLFKVLKKNEKF